MHLTGCAAPRKTGPPPLAVVSRKLCALRAPLPPLIPLFGRKWVERMHDNIDLTRLAVHDNSLHGIGAKFEHKTHAGLQPIEALLSRRHYGCVWARPWGLSADDAQGTVGQSAVEPISLSVVAIK